MPLVMNVIIKHFEIAALHIHFTILLLILTLLRLSAEHGKREAIVSQIVVTKCMIYILTDFYSLFLSIEDYFIMLIQ